MALYQRDDALYISSLYQIWKFVDLMKGKQTTDKYDSLFSPRQSWVTGDVDVHDLYAAPGGKPFFVNTLFSCIAEVDDVYNFKAICAAALSGAFICFGSGKRSIWQYKP
jgi:uncharacterized protein (TIGR03032 family)